MKRAHLISRFFLVAAVFLCGECLAAVVRGPQVDPRDMAIDRQVGGMEEGSRITHPHHDVGEQQAHQKVQGTGVSGLGKETHATAASGAQNAPHSMGLGTGIGSAAAHAGTGATEHDAGVGTHVGGATAGSGQGEAGQTEAGGNQPAQEGNHGVFIGGNLIGSGETTTGENLGGSIGVETGTSGSQESGTTVVGGGSTGGTGTAGSEGASTDRSIIEVETNVNLSGESPSASGNISVDTNAGGGLLDANTATNAGSASQQISSPLEHEISSGSSTGSTETSSSGSSNYIVEADANLTGDPSLDVTVDTSASGGLLDASAVTDAGTVNQQLLSESSHETSSTSTQSTNSGTTSTESTDRSIIEAETNVNLSGGSPSAEANVSIDTTASGGLVDLDTATNADVAEQELTSSTGLEIGIGADTISGESELSTEIGVGSEAPPAGEIESGLEADVEGVGATEDTASDPADGLSTSTSTVPGL